MKLVVVFLIVVVQMKRHQLREFLNGPGGSIVEGLIDIVRNKMDRDNNQQMMGSNMNGQMNPNMGMNNNYQNGNMENMNQGGSNFNQGSNFDQGPN
jgi:hypothetical protein